MACAARTLQSLPQPSVVSVNGVAISRDAIAREVQHHPAPRPIVACQAAARALVIRELLLQEARRLGIEPAPRSDESGRREAEEEALVRGLIEQQVVTPEADEAACRRYYDQNLRRFRLQPIYAATHILFAVRRDQEQGYAQAQAMAASVLADLKARPEQFGELARTYSACSSAAQGGSLGQIVPGQTTPEFEQALAQLTPGSTCQAPVETCYGIHIIRLDDKVEGAQLPFESVAGRIADYLRESVTNRATAQYIARLVSAAEIIGITLDGPETHRVD